MHLHWRTEGRIFICEYKAMNCTFWARRNLRNYFRVPFCVCESQILGWNSVVDTGIRYELYRSAFELRWGRDFAHPPPPPPDRPRAPHSFLYNGHRVPFQGIKVAGARGAYHPAHLAPRWKKKVEVYFYHSVCLQACYRVKFNFTRTKLYPVKYRNMTYFFITREETAFFMPNEILTSFDKSFVVFLHPPPLFIFFLFFIRHFGN